ncbi:COP9 signalosome complex subunit 9 isoform X1 [Ictalurus furcatus]|uniref:COP9 signalosome complex subunit 9 isoform X1 n=1 Tax=Ictalurus furcatus TaxID=66913 RepID=UPI002350094B|nr:COP9 signalosome complex subunit 9 isoform X1 [Ictalurus furcatus]
MKPAVDEMFPEGAGPYVDLDEAGGSTGLLMDLAANEKAVHSDFFNAAEKSLTRVTRKQLHPQGEVEQCWREKKKKTTAHTSLMRRNPARI